MNRLFVKNNRRDTYVVCCFSNPFVKVQTRMDAIKAKMKKLTSETEEATVKANRFEAEALQASGEAEKIEHNLAVLQKKYQSQVEDPGTYAKETFLSSLLQELSYDVAIEDLFNLSIKLEEREKVLANAEGEVGSGIRRVFLLEGEAEKREIRLATEVRKKLVLVQN